MISILQCFTLLHFHFHSLPHSENKGSSGLHFNTMSIFHYSIHVKFLLFNQCLFFRHMLNGLDLYNYRKIQRSKNGRTPRKTRQIGSIISGGFLWCWPLNRFSASMYPCLCVCRCNFERALSQRLQVCTKIASCMVCLNFCLNSLVDTYEYSMFTMDVIDNVFFISQNFDLCYRWWEVLMSNSK